MSKTLIKLLSILIFSLVGCIGAGTHGSIKGYEYLISKDSLQHAVMTVIKNNPNIYRDTSLDSLGRSPALDHLDDIKGGNYSAGDNYYNDIKHYVTITISSGQIKNEYVFRYQGSDKDWKTSRGSEIFICYAHDRNGKGGSEGTGGLSRKMTKEFTDFFENQFIFKIDKQLNLTHSDAD